VKTRAVALLMALVSVLILSACQTMEVATDAALEVGKAGNLLTDAQAVSIRKGAGALSRSFEDFTPEQEYYLGRSVSAVILSKYKPFVDERTNRYINTLGQALSQVSDLPEVFNGYHFLVLDSEDINAFAAPGGLIFVTRGLLRCCKTEDAAAAVLAHEIGHAQLRHGLQAIKAARVTDAVTIIAMEGAKTFGSKDLAKLTETFEGSISDIAATLINSGYSRTLEFEADRAAITILKRLGYDPNGLPDMLGVMRKNLKPGSLDFAKTHPSPEDRIAEIGKFGGDFLRITPPTERRDRFQEVLHRI
jgi:predicted Zn-dependent protease